MSSLTENLQQIYSIKQDIKEAIGTSSDIFADYPAYISAMAGGITPTGYAYVTSNGDYDVSSYAMVNVEVSGGSSASGTLSYDLDPDAGYPVDVDVASYAYISLDLNGATVEITSNGNYNTLTDFSYDFVTGINVDVSSGPVQGVDSHAFVSIRPGLIGYSNYPYFSSNEDGNQYIYNNELVPFTDTYDTKVNVHTLISDAFPSWGIDPNDFVSSIKKFEAYDWNSGDPTALQDLTCTTMLQEGDSNYGCWCIVEGTLLSDTDVCFKSDSAAWDGNDWLLDRNETLLECMPAVEKYEDPYSPYGWSTNCDYTGTYIHLEAGPVRLYLHYTEGDGSMCDVFYNVYDDLNSQFTAKWYNMAETGAMTFVNTNANEPDPGY